MRQIGSEVAAGVAIFVAFIAFIAGFLFLKNTTLSAGQYNITIRFDDVTGLERGDPVSISGLRVGKVESFTLDGTVVLVNVRLQPEALLPEDSKVSIKSMGMVGEKFIDITPGKAPKRLSDGAFLRGETSSDLEAITGKAETLMDEAQELMRQLREMFATVLDASAQESMQQTLVHAGKISATLDNNTSHMESTLANLDELTANINEILAEKRDAFESSIDNLHAASNKLEGMAGKIDESLGSLEGILAKIDRGEGSAGKLLADDELYNKMRDLTAELDALILDMKKRPGRYVNLGFIKIF